MTVQTVPDVAAAPAAAVEPARAVLMKGNVAMAEAAVQAGCDAYFGYPITPQAELLEWMARRMPELGRVFVQAESEVAAINMALGAAATGARVLVSSSSPGISLMAEGMSYLAGSELPMVLINVMRGGPGLGSIGPSQADYFQAVKGHGHGDYRVPVLAPASIAGGGRAGGDRVRGGGALSNAGHAPGRRHPWARPWSRSTPTTGRRSAARTTGS